MKVAEGLQDQARLFNFSHARWQLVIERNANESDTFRYVWQIDEAESFFFDARKLATLRKFSMGLHGHVPLQNVEALQLFSHRGPFLVLQRKIAKRN